jgi:DNA modification methylase
MTTASTIVRSDTALDTVTHGDCIEVMGRMASAAVDFVLTDPPTSCAIARARARA